MQRKSLVCKEKVSTCQKKSCNVNWSLHVKKNFAIQRKNANKKSCKAKKKFQHVKNQS